LQRPPLDELESWILKQYRVMYEAFFEERRLIQSGHFHEVRYEDLEADPVGQVRSVYEALDLPTFSRAAVEQYVGRVAGYKKNQFPALSVELRQRIAREWRFCFEQWGYATERISSKN
jgi:hypothetical protein